MLSQVNLGVITFMTSLSITYVLTKKYLKYYNKINREIRLNYIPGVQNNSSKALSKLCYHMCM